MRATPPTNVGVGIDRVSKADSLNFARAKGGLAGASRCQSQAIHRIRGESKGKNGKGVSIMDRNKQTLHRGPRGGPTGEKRTKRFKPRFEIGKEEERKCQNRLWKTFVQGFRKGEK